MHVKNSIFGASSKSAEVPFVDVEAAVEHWPAIDLLKCDIEGAELLFLENYAGLLAKVDVAIFELHPNICDAQKAADIITSAGFDHQELRRNPDTSVNLFRRRQPAA